MRIITRLPLLAAFATLMAAAGGCGSGDTPAVSANIGAGDSSETTTLKPTVPTPDNGGSTSPAASPAVENPFVVFKTSEGDIKVELNAEKAPVTVENFLSNYVRRGHYKDTIFHYVDAGNIVVGGGYDSGGELKETRAEIQSEADNGLSNKRGTLAMARSPGWQHSATSQFFFNLKDNPSFDHQSKDSADTYGYCVFGTVVSGHDVLEKISATPVHESEISPKQPQQAILLNAVEIAE